MRFPRAVSVDDLPRAGSRQVSRPTAIGRLAWRLASNEALKPAFTPHNETGSEHFSVQGIVNPAADLSAADAEHFLRLPWYTTRPFRQGRGRNIVLARKAWGVAAPGYGFVDQFNVGGGVNVPPELLDQEFTPEADGSLRPTVLDVERVSGVSVPFCHYGYTAFGHFVLDGLLQIHLWEKALQAGDAKLVHWPLQDPWMQPVLEACGLPPSAQHRLGKPLALLQQAQLSSALAGHGVYHPASYSQRFFRWLAAKFPAHAAPGPEKIYVRRSKGSPRPVANAAELEDLARAHGFLVVDPSEHSFADQVRLFAGAGTAMSVWGSTLTLAPLLSGRRRVVELLPAGVMDAWFFHQAVVHGLDYLPVLHPPGENASFVADLAAVERALRVSEQG